MARIFITGSTEGLGLASGRALVDQGHEVVLHARSKQKATALAAIAPPAAGIVIGDLSSAEQTRAVAEQVNRLGPMQAVIHNAGVYEVAAREPTAEGHALTLAVNTLAPYLLTALIEQPQRLIYLSSGLHRSGGGTLDDIDWHARRWDWGRAYAESKLYLTTLAMAVARHWPDVRANAVDPGWVRTRMGGAGAPVNLKTGVSTQTWLAASDEAAARVSGGYWHHREQRPPAAAALDPDFQDRLMRRLAELTGLQLF